MNASEFASSTPDRSSQFGNSQEVENLRARLEKDSELGFSFSPWLGFGAFIGFLLFCEWFIPWIFTVSYSNAPWVFGGLLGLVIAGGFSSFRYYQFYALPKLYRRKGTPDYLRHIADSGDHSFIPVLTRAWWSTNLRMQYAVLPALTGLFEQLDERHEERLTVELLQQFHRILAYANLPISYVSRAQEPLLRSLNADCIAAMIRALARIRDIEAIPSLRILARSSSKEACKRKIVQATRESLPILEAMQAEAVAPRILLRPSDDISDYGKLLRPVSANNETEISSLLRPSLN